MAKVIPWEPSAAQRLKKAPFFVRPLIKARAEQVARQRGLSVIDEKLLDELKGKEHKK